MVEIAADERSRGCELMRAVEDGRFGYKYRPGDLLNSNPFSHHQHHLLPHLLTLQSNTCTTTTFPSKPTKPPPSFKMFKALIVALAAVAAAIPTQHPSSNEMKCGGDVYCCNSGAVGQAGIPIDVAKLTCDKIAIIGDVLNNQCTGQAVCCNDVQQTVSIPDNLFANLLQI